ncbi:MAG: GNAT family N-acetyltransferase [Blastocatellia bacterium]
MYIRPYKLSDTKEIMQLFYDTIHNINIKDYSLEQVRAWAPSQIDEQKWQERLISRMTYVVEANEKILGFSELETNGHIDCFYSHKDYQGKGVGSLMIKNIESQAKLLKINKLYAEVSITAKPFFQHHGFQILNAQQVSLRGQTLTNYLMEKYLSYISF